MIKNIQAIRGMSDCLPEETVSWQKIEKILKEIVTSYGYSEIRLPIIEKTPLFQRAIGEITDVVEKEMYNFFDRKGNSLTLRPEGTAGCARAGIQHGILYNQEQRLWYMGPMFRYERPQKGRYRQFYQMGVEVFGQKGPDVDTELILLASRWWRALGINDYVSLELNSIGSVETRMHYRKALMIFLDLHKKYLDEDSRRRVYTNPMRILDTKNPDIQTLLDTAPLITDYLDKNSKEHFYNLCELLNLAGITYKINPRLVRGLDYYNQTVFEWVTSCLGSQDAICAGGRYDGLVEQLGGRATPAVGFAMGMERLILLVNLVNPSFIAPKKIDAYLVIQDAQPAALKLAEQLRDELPFLRLMTNYGGGGLKKQFTRAHKYGARIALILGKNEATSSKIMIKDLATGNQETLTQKHIAARIASILA